jgi:drug/metabolite transporter (DMT)-like permease
MDRRAWALLLILGAIWGASYLFIKIGLRDLSPSMVAWARVLLAALVLVPLARVVGGRAGGDGIPRWRERLPMLALVSVTQVAGPFLLIAAGEQEISSSLAGILITSAPLFTAVLAIPFDPEERSTGFRLVGIGLGFVGVSLLLGVDLGDSGAQLLGGAAVLLAGFGYAVSALLAKRKFGDSEPISVAAGVMLVSALLLAPFGVASAPDAVPSIGPIAAIATLGILGTGIAFALFYSLIRSIGPAKTYVVTYIAPGFAVVYGTIFLDERISAATIAGLALIVGGSWLAAGGLSVGEEAAPGGAAEVPVGDHAA